MANDEQSRLWNGPSGANWVEAQALLAGERLTPELIDRAADVAARPSRPLDNTDLTHPYRKRMTRVFVARALRRLAGLSVEVSKPDPDGVSKSDPGDGA